MSLDTATLYFIATMIAAMLGVMLLVFGKNENIPALKWWGSAYLVGAASVALWTLASNALGGVLSLALNAVGFVAMNLPTISPMDLIVNDVRLLVYMTFSITCFLF